MSSAIGSGKTRSRWPNGPTGYRPSEARPLNRAAVLALLRSAPKGRAELARDLGLSKPSLSDVVGSLLEDGLVLEQTPTPTSRGRFPARLLINPQRFSVLGIDLSPHALYMGVFDASGKELDYEHDDLINDKNGEALYAHLLRQCRLLLERSVNPVVAVGIATPGPVNAREGVVLNPPRFSAIQRLPIVEWLERDLGIPTRLEHDSAAAAIQYLHSTTAQNFVYVLLTEGIGAGLVIGRTVYRGQHGFAAELGQVLLSQGSGARLEECSGALGTVSQYHKLSGKQQTLEQIALLARSGDPQAKAAFEHAGRTLGWGVAVLVNLLDPACLVFGGSVTAYADCWLPSVASHLSQPHHTYLGALDLNQPLPLVVDSALQPVASGAAECVLEAIYRGEIALPGRQGAMKGGARETPVSSLA